MLRPDVICERAGQAGEVSSLRASSNHSNRKLKQDRTGVRPMLNASDLPWVMYCFCEIPAVMSQGKVCGLPIVLPDCS